MSQYKLKKEYVADLKKSDDHEAQKEHMKQRMKRLFGIKEDSAWQLSE